MANNLKAPPALLRSAAALIDRALGQLDTTHTTCDCCGMKRYHNMTEYRASDRLKQMANRLDEIAGTLDGQEPRPMRREEETT